MRLGSLAWWGIALVRNDFNASNFRSWLFNKYSKTYACNIFNYCKKHSNMISGDLRELDSLSPNIRDHVIKALICLSKYLGIYEDFKSKLKQHGIKWIRSDSFSSFLRIFNTNSNGNDILEWYRTAISNVRDNEKILLKFLLYSGLRKSEAILSFNRIIELNNKGLLDEYYDKNLDCLLHFKYPKEFIRRTKNCFISFIPEELLKQICNSKKVTYEMIRKRLFRNSQKIRINELRDYFGTYLLQHGILEAEINLCQGRIPPSIFIKHYWSPKLSELRDRIFKALKDLEQTVSI